MAEEEVVPNNAALGVVAGWLGLSVDEALDEAGHSDEPDPAGSVARPQFLGLGAKFLPHHKAVHFAAALDTKLKQRLERGRDGQQGPGGIGGAGRFGLATGQRGGVFKNGVRQTEAASAGAADQEGSSSEGEDEDQGRSHAFAASGARRDNGATKAQAVGPFLSRKSGAAADGAEAGTSNRAAGDGREGDGQPTATRALTAKERQQQLLFGSQASEPGQQAGAKKRKKRKKGSGQPSGEGAGASRSGG